MSGKTEVTQSQQLAGLEFIKLGRMERYLLNEFIARMDTSNDREALTDPAGKSHEEGSSETPEGLDVIWRGNRRRHYRVDMQSTEFYIELDFRPVYAKVFSARVVNISASGCLVVLPEHIRLTERDKIPWLRIPCNGKTIVCRALVVHTKSF